MITIRLIGFEEMKQHILKYFREEEKQTTLKDKLSDGLSQYNKQPNITVIPLKYLKYILQTKSVVEYVNIHDNYGGCYTVFVRFRGGYCTCTNISSKMLSISMGYSIQSIRKVIWYVLNSYEENVVNSNKETQYKPNINTETGE